MTLLRVNPAIIVFTSHTDRYTPPSRTFKTIKYRPLPESSVRRFGEWIVGESWGEMNKNMSPSKQAEVFEQICQNKLDMFCPEKTVRVSSQDKKWINKELKILHRQKSREWVKRGKSQKYLALAKKFDEKYKLEAEKYLKKNMDELMESQPGRAYKILNRMGAQPGDCVDSEHFYPS